MKIQTDTDENIVVTQYELGKLYTNVNRVFYTLFDKLEEHDKIVLQEALDAIRAVRNKDF